MINKLYPQITEFLDGYKKQTTKSQSSLENSIADELQKYANLMNQGVITKEEFDVLKKDLLGLKTEDPKAIEPLKSSNLDSTASVNESKTVVDEAVNHVKSSKPNTTAYVSGFGFKMVVDDIFNIRGRGNVLTGTVETASISLGDNVDIFDENSNLIEGNVTIIGIERLGKLEKKADEGDNVGILLKLRLPQQVHKGCYILKVDGLVKK